VTFGIERDFRDSQVAAADGDASSAEPINAKRSEGFSFMIPISQADLKVRLYGRLKR
jgi:hypothetical protein